ncbi:pyridine nucleotide-disulfide oxidoreductase [Acidihalobacter yilgarnensis]|uniref:Dihydrolipoyl dehydrogenase n=1 Tax=Acidihalobacter yilgarnensis TaxID=2819280 RepID=A0A1D8IQ37_9GAMM|nr:NAD(P)/FAD-dependent oxidoreductase [Acidihalobacter yilgarnensis]AOU98610.1 pyridine nucleotide-disulfide oxidoreductase [Acidihalobacter yilgarnensis]
MNEAPYDIAVIGSGPGGYRAAILAALKGQRVAIIEKADWGGCCLNRGCVPKKDWHHTAQLVAASRHFAGRGITGTLSADMATAWMHQEAIVANVQESYVDYMKRLKITTLSGNARFDDPHTLIVQGADGSEQTLGARAFVIATGAGAQVPPPFEALPGKVLTSDMLFDAPPPDGNRVAIIGSGVIATEFAFIFRMLGKEVVWLARSEALRKIPFSPQARTTLKNALARHDIALRRVTGFASVDTDHDGVRIMLTDGDAVEVDWVCLGTGRMPYTEGLNIEAIGIECDAHGFIRRNAQLQTAQPHIYAIGDVASPEMTANHALADATVAIGNIVDGHEQAQDSTWVPLAVYSAVELARIGMDEDTAEDEGLEPAVGFAAFETSPRALGQDDTDGFVRLIADMDSGALLGGEIIGAEAGELIHLLSLAPDRESALRWLAAGRYNHPARAEELANATETLASKWGLAGSILG